MRIPDFFEERFGHKNKEVWDLKISVNETLTNGRNHNISLRCLENTYLVSRDA